MTTMLEEQMAKESGIRRGTGRERAEWFAALDAWGAVGRPYRETAGWLREQHGLSAWWAQKITVEYEQARGTREPGARPGGSFEVGASKAIGVPPERALAAFTDGDVRGRWLPDIELKERPGRPDGMVRFDVGAGGERLAVAVEAHGADRCQVTVQHERLPDAAAAAAAKGRWRERLTALKTLLEDR